MKRLLQIFTFLVLISLAFLAAALYTGDPASGSGTRVKLVRALPVTPMSPGPVVKKLESKSGGLIAFCENNGFNTSYSFMIDMSLPSGKQRFFIYDLKKKNVLAAGLVTHGSGSVSSGDQLVFSNKPGSNCTSLGKYKIGRDYHGRFGLAYKLHGLDAGNSKAFERFVVLHAHTCVPAREVYPLLICPSLGCPTVSPPFLQQLKTVIDGSAKPILLYIYT